MTRTLLSLFVLALPLQAANTITVLTDKGLKEPFGMDFLNGKLVLTEYGGHRVVQLEADGSVTVIAGSGKAGFADGVGEAASFNAPHNLVVAADGMIYVADTSNHRVRKVDPKTRMVTTIAGSNKGFAVEKGPAKDAMFDQAYHVSLDGEGKNLFVCDLGNRQIRKIDLKTNMISTVAGNGQRGAPKDGAIATEAPLIDPRVVTVDKTGRIWILERAGHCLRVVENGKIRTVAGTGTKGFEGDGGPALKARMDGPKYLWIDTAGDVLIADTENHCIRKFVVKDGTMQRLVGTGKKGKAGVGGNPLDVQLARPHGVAIGSDGTLYIADSDNHRVLKITK